MNQDGVRTLRLDHGRVHALDVELAGALRRAIRAAIEILRFATSTAHLQELVYGGKSYGVSEAYRLGLVDEVTAPDRLGNDALAVAARLASDPAARFRITKRQLRRPVLDRIDRYAGETDADVVAEWKNPRTLEAIRTHMDEVKRRPRLRSKK